MRKLDPKLKQLLSCHSTPGDEAEVAEMLLLHWQEAGLPVQRHGHYAVSAGLEPRQDRPTLLVCAHMDSPGFSVESVTKQGIRLVELGKPRLEADSTPAVLKTAQGKYPVSILRQEHEDEMEYFLHEALPAEAGDRVCFAAATGVNAGGEIEAPFIDNRVGCWLLTRLAQAAYSEGNEVNLILGATACEEMGGFGAPVLANAVAPDAVICIDATYENEEQDVLLGHGPVLTLSDASVLLSPAARDQFQQFMAARSLPLQTEVYNFSGTDARAFPQQGLSAPVFPLLIPSRGNHSAREVANIDDMLTLEKTIQQIAVHGQAAGLF